MKRLIPILLFLLPLYSEASHIVGGEFELLRLLDGTYRINMILYFDLVNGSPGAKDDTVHVYLYRRSDHQRMKRVVLSLSKEQVVNYTQNQCADGSLQTNKMIYTAITTLPEADFGDPGGYMMEYQRCCRNYSITNIFSEVPPPVGNGRRYAGQTFYLEFPPVVKDGKPFINSSPHIFPPLSDYACIGRRYYVDFAGVDDDGDSLAYSLTTPLNTTSNAAYPGPDPGPFPEVQWRPGFDLQHITGGSPDMKITVDGFITVTPKQTGLFVFAVKCQEFRNGVKIGETRRDFQMLVQDCKLSVAPVITGKKLADATFTAHGTMDVTFDNTVTDPNRCIQVRVSDNDSKDPAHNFQETVHLRAVALNFKKKDLSSILPAITVARLTNGSNADFTVCFDKCPLVQGGPMQIGIIAFDEACALPLSDTLKVNITVEPPPNHDPYFVPPKTIAEVVPEGGHRAWNLHAVDDDGDSLLVAYATDGFALADAGMTYNALQPVKGSADVSLQWDAFCDIYNFTHRNAFQVKVFVEDKDVCNLKNNDVATFNLTVLLPTFPDPHLDTDLTPDPDETVVHVTRHVYESLDFVVSGDISNDDSLKLSMTTTNFVRSSYPIQFAGDTARHHVQVPFHWAIGCDNLDLAKKDTFDIRFVVLDNTNKCRLPKSDTVLVKLKVLPPDNQPPTLSLDNLNPAVTVAGDSLAVLPGTPIQLQLVGTDQDTAPADHLTLRLFSATGNVTPTGFSFKDATGLSQLRSAFAWTPDCSMLSDATRSNHYQFRFALADDRCITKSADTLTLKIRLADVLKRDVPLNIPNVITPNGDGCNDYFAVDGIDVSVCYSGSVSPDEQVGLPPDNCVNRFEKVVIVNRWGQTVFTSTDRKFRWYAPDASAGVFFYDIHFTQQRFKGALTVSY